MFFLIRLIKKTYAMAGPHEGSVVMKNVASLSWLQGITYILPLIILPYLFRVIGPDRFGLIAFAQAFVQYFMILTDYGFGVSATKEISLAQDHHGKVSEIFSSVMTAKIGLAFLSFLMLGLAVYFIPKFRNDWPVYLVSFGTVVGNTIFPLWFFQGTEKMNHIAEVNIAGGVITALFIFCCVKGPQDYLLVPLIHSAAAVTTGILGQYIVFRRFGVAFKFQEYRNVRQQLKAGWDIFISIIAVNAYTTTRVFTIGLLTSNTITGFYSIAEKVAGAVQTFPLMSFSQAIFPRLSKIFHKNKTLARKIMEQVQLITVTISLMVLPIIFLFAHSIVRLVCGGDYQEVVLSLRILLVSIFFISANAFRVQFLLICGKTDIYSRIHVTMAMIGLPLIFLLIHSFSYVGAAIATLIIEAGIFTLTYYTVRKLTV